MYPATIDWKQLRFGVEVEFIGGRPGEVELLPGWVMAFEERQTDDTGRESGSELKPPPIRWEDRDQIRIMLDRLRATGATANWNCGLHVHVGLEPWGEAVILPLLEAALKHQESLRQLLDTGADRLIFCPPVTPDMLNRFLAEPGSAAALHNPGRPQSHRCGIHVAPWYDIGTVEIRYANGSLDVREVLNTVELCLRFVAAVGAGRPLPLGPRRMAEELGAPVTGYPRPIPAPQWYRERMWLERILVPHLEPLARSLVPGGEIHHILPVPEGLLMDIEDPDGMTSSHLVRPPAEGWEAVRRLPESFY